MDRLILLRHGKAEQDSESGEDFDRRLKPRGERESAAMGESLAKLGYRPDLALVSPAARTRETWAAAQLAFGAVETRLEPSLYNAEAGTIRRAAERAGEGLGTVIVVAHNPGLQELAVALMREAGAPASLIAKAQRHFPPAAAAVFDIDAAGRPVPEGLFLPEKDR
jgi:phosphohistidine phosphatase